MKTTLSEFKNTSKLNSFNISSSAINNNRNSYNISILEENSLEVKKQLQKNRLIKSNTNPYDKPKIKEQNLIKEKYIPDLNIVNFRSRQSVVLTSVIEGKSFTFIAYPSLHCFINLVDVNLDNKHITQLSTVNYWSVLEGHKSHITELNYFDKEFQEPLLVSLSLEGRMILWLQKPGRIVKSQFLNEVNIKVDLFDKFKVFNLDCNLSSMSLIEESKFYSCSNNKLKYDTRDVVFPLFLTANEDNLVVSDLEGTIVTSLFTDSRFHDNYILEYFTFSEKDFNYNIVFSGSQLGNGLKAFNLEINDKFDNYSSVGSNNSYFNLIEIYHVDFEKDITSISINNETDTILISTGSGKIVVMKAKVFTEKILVDTNTPNKDNVEQEDEFFGSKYKLNTNYNNEFNNNSNLGLSKTNSNNYKKNSISLNLEEVYEEKHSFIIETLYDITLDGCVFTTNFIKRNTLGYAMDLNNFDVKSDSGFGVVELFSNDNNNQPFNYEDKNVTHRSYILNYEVIYESVIKKLVLITLGLDKRIKIYTLGDYLK